MLVSLKVICNQCEDELIMVNFKNIEGETFLRVEPHECEELLIEDGD